MEMTYSGTLMMPANYAVVNEEEMTYVDGGWNYSYSKSNIAVPMKAMYLSKLQCFAFASYVIGAHGNFFTCNGMGRIRIASELFAHAIGYYCSSALYGIGLKAQWIKDIKDCGSVADIGLGDGLDLAYSIIWSVL